MLWATLLTAGPAVRDARVEATLLAEAVTIAPGEPFTVALQLRHDAHWHSYWINPGTGYATDLKWDLPPGFTAGPIQWPTPTVLRVGDDVAGYGYEDTIWLPVTITPPADLTPGTTVTLRVLAEWLMCRVECVPGEARLEHTVRVGERVELGDDAADWAAARARLPGSVEGVTVRAFRSSTGGRMELLSERPLPTEIYFFSADGQIDYRPAQTLTRSADGRRVELELTADAAVKPLPRLPGVLAAQPDWPKGQAGWEIDVAWEEAEGAAGARATADSADGAGPAGKESLAKGVTGAAPGPDETGLGGLGLVGALFGAFVGGLILNLMPCVFPVLGIKVLGFVEQAGSDRRKAIGHGLLFALGVVLSFWVLAGVLLALRAGGANTAWGFQLQSPGFVFGLAVFLLLMALSFSGVFEVGGRLIGVGSGAMARGGAGSSFLSGVLATVVATPCSAPFLGTALGVALAVPPVTSFALFTAIALGLAAPYVILTAWPALLRLLPRPGAWMETFRQAMAFPLYATVAWLAWVLAALVEGPALLFILLALVLVATAAWIFGRWTGPERRTSVRRGATFAALALGLGGVAYAWPRAEPEPVAGAAPEVVWQDWSESAVAAAVAAGQTVYIDFTARWCFTCQTNKAVVFSSDAVRQRFHDQKVVALRADWTRRDAVIAAALARYGRAAVPTNVVYLPGRAEPEILPELLTPGIVLEALGQ